MSDGRFETLFNEKYENKFKLLSEYTSAKDNVSMLCLICGKINSGRADHVLNRNRRCPHCTEQKKFQRFKKITNEMSEDFQLVNYVKQVRIIEHLKCGRRFKIPRKDFSNRCPICDEESKYLLTHSTIGRVFKKFVSNKTVQINNKIYNFDFYVPSYDLYIDLFGDYIRHPLGRPDLFISYDTELKIKKDHVKENSLKYLLLKNRTDILDVLLDFQLYFKNRRCTFKHFNRWRVSQKIK